MFEENQIQYKLPNGITLLYDKVPGNKSFIISITTLAGSRDDFKGKSGLAHFVEHQLFRRNEKNSYSKIAREFERTGTLYNAFTEHEMTLFFLKSLNEHFEKVYRLLTDFFICPVFDAKDFQKEKKIILEEIKSYQDDPEEFIFDLGNEVLYPKNPLGGIITGTEKSIEKIEMEDIREFFEKYYFPENIVISFVGDIPFDQVRDISEKIFSDYSKPKTERVRAKLPENIVRSKVMKKSIEQSHILLLRRFDTVDAEFSLKMRLLSYCLGESPSSMVYHNLREKSGLVYNAFSNLEQYTDTNVLQLYFAIDKENIDKSMKILDEIEEKIKSKKISRELFTISKSAMIAQHIYKLEIPYEKMMNNVKEYQLNGNFVFRDDFIEKMKLIKYEEFSDFAAKIISEQDWSGVKLLQR
ncbi:MAG: hypothetical protein A2X64_05685 [Ignavibacteria bacterium GWF2_33_9]|nr:MAG: hypothetical protein A2X64_05685 [Ignavibacteria bacterium GWF2_33_9]